MPTLKSSSGLFPVWSSHASDLMQELKNIYTKLKALGQRLADQRLKKSFERPSEILENVCSSLVPCKQNMNKYFININTKAKRVGSSYFPLLDSPLRFQIPYRLFNQCQPNWGNSFTSLLARHDICHTNFYIIACHLAVKWYQTITLKWKRA